MLIVYLGIEKPSKSSSSSTSPQANGNYLAICRLLDEALESRDSLVTTPSLKPIFGDGSTSTKESLGQSSTSCEWCCSRSNELQITVGSVQRPSTPRTVVFNRHHSVELDLVCLSRVPCPFDDGTFVIYYKRRVILPPV